MRRSAPGAQPRRSAPASPPSASPPIDAAPADPRAATPSRHALVSGTAAYLATSLVWGANIPITTILFHTFDPFLLSFVRVALAALLLAGAVALTQGWRCLAIPLRPARFVAMTFAMAGFFVFYNLGLRYTNTITAAAIMAGAPVYAALTMRLTSGTPLERGFWPAAALTVIGAGLAVWSRSDGAGLRLEGGEALIVLSFVCWTLYSMSAQQWFEPGTPQLRRTWVATAGSMVWLLPCWLAVLATGMAPPPNLSPGGEALFWLVFTAFTATALGGTLWNIGVARAGLAAGVLWQNTVPVFGVLISMAFGFVPTGGQVLGGAIVLAGVLTMQWHRLRRR